MLRPNREKFCLILHAAVAAPSPPVAMLVGRSAVDCPMGQGTIGPSTRSVEGHTVWFSVTHWSQGTPIALDYSDTGCGALRSVQIIEPEDVAGGGAPARAYISTVEEKRFYFFLGEAPPQCPSRDVDMLMTETCRVGFE
eukprot:2482867-Prymnesium_polylepis.1